MSRRSSSAASIFMAAMQPLLPAVVVMIGLLTGRLAIAADTSPLTVTASIDVMPDVAWPGCRFAIPACPPNTEELTWAAFHSYVAALRVERPDVTPVIIQRASPQQNHFVLVEVWPSLSAFNVHVMMPASRQLRAALTPLLATPFDQRLLLPM